MIKTYFTPPKYAKFAIFCTVLFINAYMAASAVGQVNNFDGRTNPFNLTLSTNISIEYLTIPRFSYVTGLNISIIQNLTLMDAAPYLCYHENASTAPCYQTSVYGYTIDNTGNCQTDIYNIYDNDYSSRTSYSFNNQCVVHSFYIKPEQATSAIIQMKDDENQTNQTLPQSCFDNGFNFIRIDLVMTYTSNRSYYECQNATGTIMVKLNSPNHRYIYEEAIFWNMTKDNSYSNIKINNQSIYYSNNNSGSTLSSLLNVNLTNNIISAGCNCTDCQQIGYYCHIPVTFQANTSGYATINLTNATYYQDMDNCTLYNQTVLNISYYDAKTSLPIQIDETGYIWHVTDGYFSYTLNGNPKNTYSHSLCSSLNSSYINHEWQLYGQVISVKKTDYVTVSYDIPSSTPLTISNYNNTAINIYLIMINESTTVKYTWQTSAYIAVSGTMYIYECNMDGSKTLVNAVPIINGDAYANIELLNQAYSYSVLYNGVLYENSETYSKCHTESASSLSFFIDTVVINIVQPIGMSSIQCNVTKTSNSTVKVAWSNNPYSSFIITGCIYAYRNGITGLIQTYVNCTNNSNYIERSIPNTGYAYAVSGKIFQGGYSLTCPQSVSFYDTVQPARTFGLMGIFSVIFLITAMALFWAGDDTKQQIGAMIGIICSWLLGILAFDWRLITSMCSFLIVIMWVGRSANKR